MTAELPSEIERQRQLVDAEFIKEAATKLLVECAIGIRQGTIDPRSRIGDATLTLRDTLNPNWPADPDWWPEGVND